MRDRLNFFSMSYWWLILLVLALAITLKLFASNMAESSIEVSISDNSLIKLPMPFGSHHVHTLTEDGDFVKKGRLIASTKDEKNKVDYIFASQDGYFVENPSCCNKSIGELYGYIVKKHQGKIVFFRPHQLNELNLNPGDKVAIRSNDQTTLGEVIIVMPNSYSPINSTYGIEFDNEPDYKLLVENQPLDLVKINTVQSVFQDIIKQVFIIRL